MQQQSTGDTTIFLALSLAVFAAVASVPSNGLRIDEKLLALLQQQGLAEMLAIDPENADIFVSP